MNDTSTPVPGLKNIPKTPVTHYVDGRKRQMFGVTRINEGVTESMLYTVITSAEEFDHFFGDETMTVPNLAAERKAIQAGDCISLTMASHPFRNTYYAALILVGKKVEKNAFEILTSIAQMVPIASGVFYAQIGVETPIGESGATATLAKIQSAMLDEYARVKNSTFRLVRNEEVTAQNAEPPPAG
jgi:hypothetical protein